MDEKVITFRKGQVAVWVILGVVLAASVLLFFALHRKPTIVQPPSSDVSFDMQSFLQQCVGKYVEEAVDIMLPQGGFIEPINAVYYNYIDVEYLCENRGFYDRCINQHPMLLNDIKKEIKGYITGSARLRGCFDEMKREFRSRDAEVDFQFAEPSVEVDLGPDRVFVRLKDEGTITKRGEVRRFEEFNIEIKNPIYDLASIAVEITSQEARKCYFELVGYNILYPKYEITKYVMSEQTKVYTVKDKKSKKEMNFAIRGCAIPPAF